MTDEWDAVGRELLRSELGRARRDLGEAFGDAEASLAVLDEAGEFSGDLEAEEIHELRQTLDRARRVVEEYAARVTDDVDPWGEPAEMPHGVYQEVLEE
jgi:hypothetical protein